MQCFTAQREEALVRSLDFSLTMCGILYSNTSGPHPHLINDITVTRSHCRRADYCELLSDGVMKTFTQEGAEIVCEQGYCPPGTIAEFSW